jgi:hypothetical protein
MNLHQLEERDAIQEHTYVFLADEMPQCMDQKWSNDVTTFEKGKRMILLILL